MSLWCFPELLQGRCGARPECAITVSPTLQRDQLPQTGLLECPKEAADPPQRCLSRRECCGPDWAPRLENLRPQQCSLHVRATLWEIGEQALILVADETLELRRFKRVLKVFKAFDRSQNKWVFA